MADERFVKMLNGIVGYLTQRFSTYSKDSAHYSHNEGNKGPVACPTVLAACHGEPVDESRCHRNKNAIPVINKSKERQ
jgi:hypothetical protein